jgi:YegS/Rv2252/BmrU family lipid kinase
VRTASLIVNPAAGGGRAGRLLGAVGGALSAHGIEYHVERTQSLEHARELAHAAAEAGELAVAFGGDGLIGAVAGALARRRALPPDFAIGKVRRQSSAGAVAGEAARSHATLGILPGGRGNDFARVLGIPLEPVAACEVLATGRVRLLDLGEVSSGSPGERSAPGRSASAAKTFVGIASCGFDSDANRIANQTRIVRGNLVYAYGALRALASWRPARFELTLDGGRTHVVTGYSVGAANSKAYGGGMYAAPGAELDDGLLDIVTLADTPKRRFLTSLLPKVFKGTHVNEPELTVLKAAEVTIAADRPFTLYADGDPIAELPVTIKALPHAVRVLVPR